MISILLILCWIGLVLCVCGLIRNKHVYNLRRRTNHEIASLKDKRTAIDIYGKYDCITYNQILYSFRTLHSWEKEWRQKIGLTEYYAKTKPNQNDKK